MAPATNPTAKPAVVAHPGPQPRTSNVAVMVAPNVIDPSAVMSGKLKTRKLR